MSILDMSLHGQMGSDRDLQSSASSVSLPSVKKAPKRRRISIGALFRRKKDTKRKSRDLHGGVDGIASIESIHSEMCTDKNSIFSTNTSSDNGLTCISKQSGDFIECPLCLLRHSRDRFPDIMTCHHRSCVDCLRQYLRIEISESRVNISCPECTERFNPHDIRLILSDDVLMEKYEEFMLRRWLVADPDCRWCPAPDCGFDVEKECSKIDEDYKEKMIVDNKAHLSKIETKIDTAGLTEKEKSFLADREKGKGNEAFHAGDYEEAIMSLSALPTVSAYNNRAQAAIKLQQWNSAVQDCEKALKLEPGNMKALLRRATAYKHQNKLQEAAEDLKVVLSVEPHNDVARKILSEIESDLKKPESAAEPQGKRMVIEEVESSGDEGEKQSRDKPEDGGGDTGGASVDELSILYSNRAACYLKEGNCSCCIQDCNRALELCPFSVKPLLRRAMAYETSEKYRKAYVDYKTVLQIDYGIQLASSSINRLTNILMELDGPKWREKLPPTPVVPSTSEPLPPAAAETPDREPQPSGCPAGITGGEHTPRVAQRGWSLNWGPAFLPFCYPTDVRKRGALCYLKLGQFEEAKLDCDQALQIDGENEKACYRLALAQEGLKNRQESLADPGQALLHPGAGEAKMGPQEATRDPDAKNGTAPTSKGRERRRIQVQEVNESSDEEPERPAEASAASPPASEGAGNRGSAECSPKLEVSKPSNAYEFGQVLNAICTKKDAEACAHLLAITAPKDLPVWLSNKLEGDMFLLLIQSLKSHLVAKDPSLVYEHLLHLSKAQRFKMTLTLINGGQKEQIVQLLDSLSHAPTDRFTVEDVQALRRQYEL
ncbi:sperm associated antigen 1 [Cricetulus griseus]